MLIEAFQSFLIWVYIAYFFLILKFSLTFIL